MKITDLLTPSDVLLDLRASNKAALLQVAARHAATAAVIESGPVFDALLRREALGSTGMGQGVAIPHARIAGLGRPQGLFARLRPPLDFAAVDERDVDLVFLLLLPDGRQTESLNALACVARVLRAPDVAKALRRASTAAELFASLSGATASPLR